MRLRRKLIAAALAGSAVVAGFSMPAQAATGATFTITAGTLSISEPASTVNLGSATTNALTLAGQLGNVTVSDERGAAVAAWTSTVSSTDFTTGGATPLETVASAAVSYSAGAGSALAGENGTYTGGTLASLATPGVAATWLGIADNHVTWNPTFTFAFSVAQVSGTYSGTITHSVV